MPAIVQESGASVFGREAVVCADDAEMEFLHDGPHVEHFLGMVAANCPATAMDDEEQRSQGQRSDRS